MKYLITYYFKHNNFRLKEIDNYHYSISDSIEEWLLKQVEYDIEDDGSSLLINVLPLSDEICEKFKNIVNKPLTKIKK